MATPVTTGIMLMKFSLGQAAKETGLDKSTISRAIKNGRLSALRKDGGGGYEIDPAELFRVFPPASKEQAAIPLPTDATTDALLENRELRIKLEAAEARLRDKNEEVQDLRRRLDLEGEERRKLTMMLLAYHPQEQPKESAYNQSINHGHQPASQPLAQHSATAAVTPKKSRMWAWLTGTR